MNMWIEHSHIPHKFLLVSYEQVHRDPYAIFEEILNFCDIPVTPSFIEKAVVESSFEKMKQVEVQQKKQEPWLRPGSENFGKSMKTRKGKVGGYEEELSTEDIQFLNEIINTNLTSQLPYC